jgi:valyl-tRNA synthetase
MENVKDWCISRQLWWGQRIPAYYLPNREVVVAASPEEALELAKSRFPELHDITIEQLHQDEDVLDTWFSSWLWPISVFDGIRYPDNADIKYYYPTNDLITAPEILFFWVARMIMAGIEYRNDIPFKNVYLTGIVRDKLGRKMSKSLGNSPDPIELIAKYGADGVRTGMLLTSPAGNDLPFDESLCEQGRNFSNKIWNALRLVKGWNVDATLTQPMYAGTSIKWFDAKLNETIGILDDHFSKYRLSDALMCVYKFVWDDFCSWYLEMVKPAYQQPIDAITYEATVGFFEKIVKLLHPFMPFVTEEIWHLLVERAENDDVTMAQWPTATDFEPSMLSRFVFASEVIMAVRNLRQDKGIPNKEQIQLLIKKNHGDQPDTEYDSIVKKLCNLQTLEYVETKVEGALSFIVRSTEFYVPLSASVDIEAELARMNNELEYTRGFLNTVMGKLSNEKFVNNAPKNVVDMELKKKADAEARISVLLEQISNLK